jgi:hypothetical protein
LTKSGARAHAPPWDLRCGVFRFTQRRACAYRTSSGEALALPLTAEPARWARRWRVGQHPSHADKEHGPDHARDHHVDIARYADCLRRTAHLARAIPNAWPAVMARRASKSRRPSSMRRRRSTRAEARGGALARWVSCVEPRCAADQRNQGRHNDGRQDVVAAVVLGRGGWHVPKVELAAAHVKGRRAAAAPPPPLRGPPPPLRGPPPPSSSRQGRYGRSVPISRHPTVSPPGSAKADPRTGFG